MHLTEPISIVIAGKLPSGVTDSLVGVAPLGQPGLDVIFICVNNRPWGDRSSNQRLDRRLLDILQHPDDDFARALEHAQDRWLLLLQRPASPLSLQPAASGGTAFFLTASGCPLCPATT